MTRFLTAAGLLVLLGTTGARAATIEIHMKNNGKDGVMVFEPGFVKAQPGDTVVFIPTDRAHNSTSLIIPAGAKPWVGKMDQKFSVKLEHEGVYVYKCDPHIPMGMFGVIQVGKAANLPEAKTKTEELAKSFVMNKDRVAKYLGQVK